MDSDDMILSSICENKSDTFMITKQCLTYNRRCFLSNNCPAIPFYNYTEVDFF